MPRRSARFASDGVKGLTRLEFEIMQILWTHGRANVRLVQSNLGQDRAYNTVQTMLNIHLKKGKVRRLLKGRAYEYTPTISSEDAIGDELRNMVDRMFCGSAEKLVVALLETQLISFERLRELGVLHGYGT